MVLGKRLERELERLPELRMKSVEGEGQNAQNASIVIGEIACLLEAFDSSDCGNYCQIIRYSSLKLLLCQKYLSIVHPRGKIVTVKTSDYKVER